MSEIGKTMWSRDRVFRGTVTKISRRYCAACGGDHDCYIVHWDDGTVTKPCANGVEYDTNGDLIIA